MKKLSKALRSPRRTALLPLQPAPQTMKVKDMPARQLLGSHVRPFLLRTRFGRHHLFATDDAAAATEALNLLDRCVRVPRAHVPRCRAISMQVSHFVKEGSYCAVEGMDVVEREHAVRQEDGVEREGVDGQLEEV